MNARLEFRSASSNIRETGVTNDTSINITAEENALMEDNDSSGELPEATSKETSPVKRSPRTVRFSDAEWQKIENAAARCGLSPAAFVRNASLADAADPDALPSETLPPGIVELIKRIYRSTYMLSTLKRDEMTDEGRSEKFEATIRAARDAEALVLDNARN